MKCPYDGYAMEFLASFTGSPAYWCPGCEKSFEEDSPELGPPEAPQNSSNEAKTPLANVSSPKDNLGSGDDRVYLIRNPYATRDVDVSRAEYLEAMRSVGIDATEPRDFKRRGVRGRVEQAATSDVFNNPELGVEGSVQHEPESAGMFSTNIDIYAPTKDFWSTSESASDISSTLHDEMEREAMRLTIDELAAKVESLRSIIDSLKAERRVLWRERDGEVWVWQDNEEDHLESLTCPVLIQPDELLAIVNAASNMKAAILQRVREKAANLSVHYSYAETLNGLATELESIQLKDEDKNES